MPLPPKLDSVRKNAQQDADTLQTWLADKLKDEREGVLLHLETVHRRLLDQFLEQARKGAAIASPKQCSPDRSPELSKQLLLAASPRDAPPTTSVDFTHLLTSPDRLSQERIAAGLLVANGTRNQEESTAVMAQMTSNQGQSQNQSTTTKSTVVASSAPSIAVVSDSAPPGGSDTPNSRISHRYSSCSELSTPQANSGGVWGRDYLSAENEQRFELFWGFLIMANSLVMALKAQYSGLQVGYELSIRTYDRSQKDAWPGADSAFYVLEVIFTICFTLEWGSRLFVHRLHFFRDLWCYFDFIIVVFAWIMVIAENVLAFNVTVVRLARFSKLLRVIRLLRSHEIFDSLKLLIAAIGASVNTLFWSLGLLLLIQCLAGLFMVQLVDVFLQDDDADVESRRKVFLYFGTSWRSMITMFEITFANWAPSCRLLIDNVNELYGLFYLFYRCVIGFAVLMVVQAVFIQQTMKATQLDDEQLAKQERRKKQKLMHRLERVFRKLDTTGDGLLEWNEFQEALQQEEVRSILKVFELEAGDFKTLFKMLDDGDGEISVEEFVGGVENMKGHARCLDMIEVKQIVKRLEQTFDYMAPGARTSMKAKRSHTKSLANTSASTTQMGLLSKATTRTHDESGPIQK